MNIPHDQNFLRIIEKKARRYSKIDRSGISSYEDYLHEGFITYHYLFELFRDDKGNFSQYLNTSLNNQFKKLSFQNNQKYTMSHIAQVLTGKIRELKTKNVSNQDISQLLGINQGRIDQLHNYCPLIVKELYDNDLSDIDFSDFINHLPENQKYILNSYLSGTSIKMLALQLDCSYENVRSILSRIYSNLKDQYNALDQPR